MSRKRVFEEPWKEKDMKKGRNPSPDRLFGLKKKGRGIKKSLLPKKPGGVKRHK